MRNLSLEAVQFTHKIDSTKNQIQLCAIKVHAPFWCNYLASHCFGALRTVLLPRTGTAPSLNRKRP
jgi:hypothetical protein